VNDTRTLRTVNCNGGGVLVRQYSPDHPFVWSVWVEGVCFGGPRVWLTRNLNCDSRWKLRKVGETYTRVQVRVYFTTVFCTRTYTVSGGAEAYVTRSSHWDFASYCWQKNPEPARSRVSDATSVVCSVADVNPAQRWEEMFAIARRARHELSGYALLDWWREEGVGAIPLLGQVWGVEPVLGEPVPAEEP
jgi:hypothetical protein